MNKRTFRKGQTYSILRKQPQGTWRWQIRGSWDTFICLQHTNNPPDGRRIHEWKIDHYGPDISLGRIGASNHRYFNPGTVEFPDGKYREHVNGRWVEVDLE